MAWLMFDSNPTPVLYPIEGSITVGRHPSCDFQILDATVSKVHCKIHARGGEFWVEDLGGLNGTRINGSPVKGERRLQEGDRLELGTVISIFHDKGAAPAGPAAGAKGGLRPTMPAAVQVTPPDEPPREEPIAGRHEIRPPARPSTPDAPVRRLPATPRFPAAAPRGPSPEGEAAPENGLLTVERGGDLQVRLWDVAVGRGGFVVRIPITEDRPPSSRLMVYAGKGTRETLCFAENDAPFEALLAEARRDGGALVERQRIRYLTGLVYRTLGGRLRPDQLAACEDACQRKQGQRMLIGELIQLGVGVCRHRAFLFFHLARQLGLRAEMFRGMVPDGRHAWNEVHLGRDRIFVDASLGIVLEGALDAEDSFGYAASRFHLPQADAGADASRVLTLGEGGEERVDLPAFRHEIRKVPGNEEAVLLLYPESDLPAVRFLHIHLRGGPEVAAMFAIAPFLASRVFSIRGDEAHLLMEAIDPAVIGKMHEVWKKHGDR